LAECTASWDRVHSCCAGKPTMYLPLSDSSSSGPTSEVVSQRSTAIRLAVACAVTLVTMPLLVRVLLPASFEAAAPPTTLVASTRLDRTSGWSSVVNHPIVRSWEFQMTLQHLPAKKRGHEAASRVRTFVHQFATKSGLDVAVSQRSSRWAVLRELRYNVTGMAFRGDHHNLPWNHATVRVRCNVPVDLDRQTCGAGPAEVSLKLWQVDVDRFTQAQPRLKNMTGAQLAVELENDVHCSGGRVSYEGRYTVQDVEELGLPREPGLSWTASSVARLFPGAFSAKLEDGHGDSLVALLLKDVFLQVEWPTRVVGLPAFVEFNLAFESAHDQARSSEVSVALLRNAPLPSNRSRLLAAQAQLQLLFSGLRESEYNGENHTICPASGLGTSVHRA